MKIKPAPADPDAVLHGLKGVQVRDTRWGWVAQKRPGPPKTPPTKLQQQYRTRFAIAARMAANPLSLDLRTAIEMARGTEQVPRDILTMAAMGRYYILRNPDGTVWRNIERPTITDALALRPPSLILAPVSDPKDAIHLADEDGNRLALEPHT